MSSKETKSLTGQGGLRQNFLDKLQKNTAMKMVKMARVSTSKLNMHHSANLFKIGVMLLLKFIKFVQVSPELHTTGLIAELD
jgi:hypothetical protein